MVHQEMEDTKKKMHMFTGTQVFQYCLYVPFTQRSWHYAVYNQRVQCGGALRHVHSPRHYQNIGADWFPPSITAQHYGNQTAPPTHKSGMSLFCRHGSIPRYVNPKFTLITNRTKNFDEHAFMVSVPVYKFWKAHDYIFHATCSGPPPFKLEKDLHKALP